MTPSTTTPRPSKALSRTAKLITIALLLSGCAGIKTPTLESWVKPYERSALEDPSMARAENPVLEQRQLDLRNRTEGARFTQFSTGEGCAC